MSEPKIALKEGLTPEQEWRMPRQPEESAPMALSAQPGTILRKQGKSGEFIQATPLQILEEKKYLLENLDDCEMMYW